MHVIKHFLVLGIMGLIFGQLPLKARAVRLWSDDDLMKASDVVAIIEAVKTEKNSDQFESGWEPSFEGLSTTFKVRMYLKGAQPSTEIIVKYFGHIAGKPFPPNGPDLVSFPIGVQIYSISWKQNTKTDLETVTEIPCWMAFLKKTADGSFVPVAGQIDSDLSFKAFHNRPFYRVLE